MSSSDALRVLMVEDSPTDVKLIVHALRNSGREVQHQRVEDSDAMRAALAEPWDIVISDWSMPRFSGLAALAMLQQMGLDVPFIIVSGTVGEDVAVEAMRAGASDYVLKDKLSRLLPAVERELRDAAVRAARRKAEQDLQTQAVRFRALIENGWDAITLTDRSGKLIYLSPSIDRILGSAPGSLVGTHGATLFHPDDRELIADRMKQIRTADAQPLEVEARALHRDGSIRWLQCNATNMLDNPAVGAIVGNIRDVTAQKRSIDNLIVAETRYRRLFESGIFGVVVADIAGNTLEANDAYLAMFGYTRADLEKGLRWTQMMPRDWPEREAFVTEELVRKGATSVAEMELFHRDGHTVPVLVGVAMLDDKKHISVIADISERKQAEAALLHTENQLRQAQKMEAVGRLAGGVAHDFNNVLSVILTYCRFISDGLKPGDPMRGDVEEISKAGERAADLTKQLLMFSRQQVVAPKVLNLNDVLINMDKMLRRILGEDVELMFLPQHPLGRIRVDPSGIEQVIMNLVVNARDAMPTGGKLSIETNNVVIDESGARAHAGLKPGQHVVFTISDTGVGMDKATLGRIFDPFFTTKEIGKGTGLGLSTVFGIVQQSGGSISVASEVGKGTAFSVFLPRTDSAAEVPKAHTELSDNCGTETILLVEDEDQVRVVARSILQRSGYKVIEARNGGEALMHCEKYAGPIHLLLTDVVMPQMSGPELSKRLGMLKPNMRLLCMSGYTDDSVVRHGVFSSEIEFIEKPLTPDVLVRKVREVLDA